MVWKTVKTTDLYPTINKGFYIEYYCDISVLIDDSEFIIHIQLNISKRGIESKSR